MFASIDCSIIVKSSTSCDRFTITIKRDIGENINHTFTNSSIFIRIYSYILQQLDSLTIFGFGNGCCQIAVEFSSRYIQSDNTGLMIRIAFNKNIVCTGCIGSYNSRQSCAINQCNGRRGRVIGDVASNFCIVRNNYR